jgi:hypothetical protein
MNSNSLTIKIVFIFYFICAFEGYAHYIKEKVKHEQIDKHKQVLSIVHITFVSINTSSQTIDEHQAQYEIFALLYRLSLNFYLHR